MRRSVQNRGQGRVTHTMCYHCSSLSAPAILPVAIVLLLVRTAVALEPLLFKSNESLLM